MKKLILTIVTLFTLLSCSNADNVKKKSVSDAPETQQEREDPVPQTISLKEVSRIALVEAEQFITNAKENGLDISNISSIIDNAKTAFSNNEYKKAQKLAVSVRQKVEELLSSK